MQNKWSFAGCPKQHLLKYDMLCCQFTWIELIPGSSCYNLQVYQSEQSTAAETENVGFVNGQAHNSIHLRNKVFYLGFAFQKKLLGLLLLLLLFPGNLLQFNIKHFRKNLTHKGFPNIVVTYQISMPHIMQDSSRKNARRYFWLKIRFNLFYSSEILNLQLDWSRDKTFLIWRLMASSLIRFCFR